MDFGLAVKYGKFVRGKFCRFAFVEFYAINEVLHKVMTSQKSILRIFEFGPHSLKEHHDIMWKISQMCLELAEVWYHVYWRFPHQIPVFWSLFITL